MLPIQTVAFQSYAKRYSQPVQFSASYNSHHSLTQQDWDNFEMLLTTAIDDEDSYTVTDYSQAQLNYTDKPHMIFNIDFEGESQSLLIRCDMNQFNKRNPNKNTMSFHAQYPIEKYEREKWVGAREGRYSTPLYQYEKGDLVPYRLGKLKSKMANRFFDDVFNKNRFAWLKDFEGYNPETPQQENINEKLAQLFFELVKREGRHESFQQLFALELVS